jgi:pimeloyl-ACP methyl ester carboxylesterase
LFIGKIAGQLFSNSNSASEDLSSSQAIVALHGFLDNSNSFKPIAPFITKSGKYHIIAVDLPGMGLSSKIPNGIAYSTKLYVILNNLNQK